MGAGIGAGNLLQIDAKFLCDVADERRAALANQVFAVARNLLVGFLHNVAVCDFLRCGVRRRDHLRRLRRNGRRAIHLRSRRGDSRDQRINGDRFSLAEKNLGDHSADG